MDEKISSLGKLVALLRQVAEKKQAEQDRCGVLKNVVQQTEETPRPQKTEKKPSRVKAKRIVKSRSVYANANGDSPEYTEAKLAADYSLVDELDSRLADIEGQPYAVQAVKEYLFGIDNRENAHGVGGLITFLGPPAVGKTLMGERIAEALHRPFLRLDMSGFNDHETGLIDLFGINKSYKAADKGGLTAFVEENPVSVVLLDEFEKAHMNVLNRFLQVFDRGEAKDLFTERSISFRNVIVIITMNLGKQLYNRSLTTYNLSNIPQATIVKALQTEINPQTKEPYLSGALVSRLATGKIVLLNKLRPETLHRITVNEIAKAEKYYGEKYGLELQIDRHVLAALLILGLGERADVRSMLKSVREFFAKNLVRLVGMNRAGKRMFSAVRLETDLTNVSSETEAALRGNEKSRILVCCKKAHKKFFRRVNSDQTEIFFADREDGWKTAKEGDFSMAFLDFEEEEKRFSGRLFGALTEREVIPVYVYGVKTKSDVPLLYYLDHGATDVFRGDLEALGKWTGNVLDGLRFTSVAQMLFRANKVLEFETSYAFESPRTAILKIAQLNVALAHEADDIEKLTSKRQIPNVRFDDVYGAKDAKTEMLRVLEILKDRKKYQRMGLRLPRGILLEGDPGTGKTLLAKAFACEAQLPFIHKNASEFRQKWQGEGARLMREVFETARRYAPSVVFIDEIDAIAKARERTVNEGSTEALNALLSEMDGFSDNSDSPVFLIAATNFDSKKDETVLDPAFLRRFDRKIHFELPDFETRRRFLADRLVRYESEVSPRMTENLAGRSIGWTFGELDNVLQNALREAYGEGGGAVTDALINEAFEKYADGERKKQDERGMKQTAIHEAGHAVVAAALGLMPSYATIGARSGYGGYVYYGDESTNALSREECLNRIAIMMAGREAEIAFYGAAGVTSGASSDLKGATELAMNMVCDYGMDESLPVYIDREKRSETPWVMRRVTHLIKVQCARARSIIEAERESVRAVAQALLEKVNLDHTDLQNILNKERS